MRRKTLNVGLIGYQFMGRAHSHALRALPVFDPDLVVRPRMRTICGRDEVALRRVAERYGWERTETNWERVVEDPEIDIVDIVAPGHLHCEIALAAAAHGKHVVCEKPLAMTGTEAGRMLDAVKRAGVKHMVNFNYRRVPAVMLAKRLLMDGRLGQVYHFRSVYQQDWPLDPDFPFIWRFDRDIAGAGSMADKGSHVIDLGRYLVGEFARVAGTSHTYIPERRDATGQLRPVTTDDAAVFVSQFEGGALGVFQTSRISAGHRNALSFEINGSKGSVRWNLERLNELEIYLTDDTPEVQGFRTIVVTQGGEHPYMDRWWPPGHIIGWEHTFVHQFYEFFKAIGAGEPTSPDFDDGMRCQHVIDAVEEASKLAKWVDIR
jgi:predicted dehydrogenase